MSPPKDKIIEPINASLDAVASALVNPRTKKTSKDIALLPHKGDNSRTPAQGELDLQIQKQIEIDGIGMGVLNDGTAFLTGRGLGRLCGVDSSRISEMATSWNREPPPPMVRRVKELLLSKGITPNEQPYIEIKQHQQQNKEKPASTIVCRDYH